MLNSQVLFHSMSSSHILYMHILGSVMGALCLIHPTMECVSVCVCVCAYECV